MADTSDAQAPPLAPDPDLVANLEGNRRLLREDRAAVRRYVEDHANDE